MDFSLKNKINPGFSVIALLNLVFLLLVFFMLTASFVTPSGVRIDAPASGSAAISLQQVSVTITRSKDFYVNDKKVTKGTLAGELKSRLRGTQGAVVIHVDKTVPSEYLVWVAGLATSLEAKVVVATKSE